MKRAVCTGSFDPITLGHVDIIKRAAKLFASVTVLILVNPVKEPAFSLEERIRFIKDSIVGLDNVRVDAYEGLMVNYAKDNNIDAVVRGLRAVSDFEYEFQMALINKKMFPALETVFLNTSVEYMYLSSSIVRTIVQFGGKVDDFVPACIVDEVEEKLSINYKKMKEGNL